MRKMLVLWMVVGLFTLSACSAMYDMDVESEPYATEYYQEGETYAEIVENEFIRTEDMPVSTFSTDVDTASYANVRRMIEDGYLPDPNAVRIEEMINYFDYDLEASNDEVINVFTEYSQAPWNHDHHLLMVGLKAEEVVFEDTDGMNLVFLIDVSGSMGSNDKLPLLVRAFELLVDSLRPKDRISIVVYAGAAGVVLEGGDSANKREIYDALGSLQAGGSTAGGEGIELAYKVAERNFIEGGNNRIIIATDGDFNVGISDVSLLEDFIAEKRDSGVFLSVLGFGTGNLRDDVLESLADHGNGVYFYIDSYKEAEKVFLNELGASMVTVAKDVKLQIEFNPLHVKGYRLIGYENRVLEYEDFEDDSKDAGDMGAGHVVIAFYEIIPANSEEDIDEQTFDEISELRYTGENYLDELMYLAIRYKDPNSDTSELVEYQTYANEYTLETSETFNFASAVVEFGLLLRDSAYKFEADFDQVISRASTNLGDDEYGYREEFVELVEIAERLMSRR
jgi:Ca-activated chloride channel family protein